MGQVRKATDAVAFLAASSLAAFLVESLLCRWPAPRPLSLTAAILTAVIYVSAAVLSGAASTWFFWFPSGVTSSVSLSVFTIASAIGWIWVPSVVLLSRQGSLASLAIAAMSAMVMASNVRKIVPSRAGTSSHHPLGGQWKQKELFAEYLNTAPREMDGLIITICVYGGFFALQRQLLSAASFLLGLCVFLLTWKLRGQGTYAWGKRESRSHSTLRLAGATSTAVLITTGLLLLGLPHDVSFVPMDALARGHRSSGSMVPRQPKGAEKTASDLSGYERIILWPVPEKKKVAVRVPRSWPAGFNMNKPVSIRFDGSYWYFQPRGSEVGGKAHIARGNPLTADVRSTNHIPVVMEAHQPLATAIPLTCCREIQVTIENLDNAPGAIALGILLTDSTSLGRQTLYLDQQTIASTEPGRFAVKSSPVPEVLRFRIPNHSEIQQFDEITVIFLPDSERPNTGAKIAIKQFDLIAR